jgi:uncharacterized protein
MNPSKLGRLREIVRATRAGDSVATHAGLKPCATGDAPHTAPDRSARHPHAGLEPDTTQDGPRTGLKPGATDDEPHAVLEPRGTSVGASSGPAHEGWRLGDLAADALGGSVVDTTSGPCVVIDRVYDADHRHGLLRLGDCWCHVHPAATGLRLLAGLGANPPGSPEASRADRAMGGGASLATAASAGGRRATGEPRGGVVQPEQPAQPSVGDVLFVDLETTGLAGGAGTYAFLVGVAWFEPGHFRVRQYFMLGHALERGLLAAVRSRFDSGAALVTYNGKSFDLPVLETRFLYNRQAAPFGGTPHVDMLHAARRLWRGAQPVVRAPGIQSDSCTLASLERALFGVQRHGDVPGFEIPGRYFAFLRSRDARPLEPVLEHNRLDLVSLAAITARAFSLLGEDGAPGEHPRECYGLGRLFERAGLFTRAEACYMRAVALAARSWHAEDDVVRVEALRALAVRCRRAGRHGEAVAHWEAITRARRCPPAVLREACEALAIHHEHRSRDLETARRYAEQSRRVPQAGSYQESVQRRLARLQRKLGHARPRLDDPRTAWLWR